MRFFKILAVLAVVTLSACCGPCRKAKSLAPSQIAGRTWQLEAVDGVAYPNSGEESYTLNFGTDGRVTGRGDCNRFFGTYNYLTLTKAGIIEIGKLGTTRMMCPDQQSDDAYIEMVQKIVKTRQSGDQLTATLSDGKILTYRGK